jgi:REP element-mobilizing transposase RayT
MSSERSTGSDFTISLRIAQIFVAASNARTRRLPICSVSGLRKIVTYARQNLLSLQDTPYYHCVARCVRRAWLWGFDAYADRDYSHRKSWVTDRLAQLTESFAIDICAYAVMANHYHVVLHVDAARATTWTQHDVVERWNRLFRIPELMKRWRQGLADEAECERVRIIVERWRERLRDISWFMRALNEHLARRANAEDNCKGRFWEGRFKSQALLDEAALLTAMAYVELNPIRAGIAASPENSPFTSIHERIVALKGGTKEPRSAMRASVPLLRFRAGESDGHASIPCHFHDYLELVDWTGRAIRSDKRGAIDTTLPPIMQRLKIDANAWRAAMRPGGNVFGRAMGRVNRMRLHARTLGQSWIRGLRAAKVLYTS